jgi:protein-disulfide isomerase
LSAVAGFLSIAAPAVMGQSNETINHNQADEILKELRLIRQLLERQQAPQAPPKPAVVSVAVPFTDPVLGKKDAPVTVVEYTDYQCSFCQRFHFTTFPELKKNFIDTGKIRFYSRDMPLDFHRNAMKAAVAARCAGDQNQFWALRDLLVANANQLDPAAVLGYAGKLTMDQAAFKSCVDSNKYEPVVKANLEEAARNGLEGTPTFVVGKSTQQGVTGALIVGAQPFSVFEKEINRLLAEPQP